MTKNTKDELWVTLFLALLVTISSVSALAGFSTIGLWWVRRVCIRIHNWYVDRHNAQVAAGKYKKRWNY
jgi:hypothetical protein